MPEPIRIGQHNLEQYVCNDMPVVTFEQVACVHEVSVETVKSSFRKNKNRFQDGKHTYMLDFAEGQQVLRAPVSPNGIRVFTEAGYLLLVKPMRDDRAWEVQERMIEAYFRDKARQRLDQVTLPPLLSAQEALKLQLARYQLYTTHREFLQAMGMLDDRDKLMIADLARQNLLGYADQPILPTPEPSTIPVVQPAEPLFFVADRVRALGYQLTRKEEAAHMSVLGKKVAKEYRAKYGVDPIKANRYVDGALRPVICYRVTDHAWIDPMIQAHMAQARLLRNMTPENVTPTP